MFTYTGIRIWDQTMLRQIMMIIIIKINKQKHFKEIPFGEEKNIYSSWYIYRIRKYIEQPLILSLAVAKFVPCNKCPTLQYVVVYKYM